MQVPLSAFPGILWPALPKNTDAFVLSLLYQMEQSQWWPPEQMEFLQMQQLTALLSFCIKHNPFYSRRLQGLANEMGKPLTMNAFKKIPLLHRKDVQEFGGQMISPKIPKSHEPRGKDHSSGSTGEPVTFLNTKVTRFFYGALNLRFNLWHQRNFMGKLAATRRPRSRNSDGIKGSAPLWSACFKTGPAVELTSEAPISEQLAWLSEEKPHHLVTYPSNLLALVRHARKKKIAPLGIREITTIGEVCSQEVRKEVLATWGVALKDMYSCMEAGLLALECPKYENYHVQSENVLVEILDDDGLPCKPGEVGRVVITDLHNFAMPFIRYVIGDYAEVGEPCPCGRNLPVLRRILGRTRNMLLLPSGDRMWPVFPITSKWSKLAPFRQIQIIQESIEKLEVKLVLRRSMSPEEEKRLTEAISGHLDDQFEVRLTVCDEIPRSKSGKFEDFQSRVAD